MRAESLPTAPNVVYEPHFVSFLDGVKLCTLNGEDTVVNCQDWMNLDTLAIQLRHWCDSEERMIRRIDIDRKAMTLTVRAMP